MTLYGSGSGFDGKLNLDFKDFFPSLNAGDFRGFLRRQKTALEPGDADALERILFWKPKGSNLLCLSIRAPSFPLLSNLLLADFDSQVTKICAANDVAYTRYADDLSFSADVSSKLAAVEQLVAELCNRTNSPKPNSRRGPIQAAGFSLGTAVHSPRK
jgi:RNA-directed DNA polymerase